MGLTNAISFMRVQQMQYYPSGLPWNDNHKASQQPYKYGGKEFVEMHGLDEYDSQARWYYPALMRTTTQDPLAEKYYDISPYAWCANNPVNLVDPDGKDIFYIDHRGKIINTEEDKTQDKFYLTELKDDKKNYSEERSISFEYGTIHEYENFKANNKQTTWFKVDNQQSAIDLFKFFADNLEIEFLLSFTEKTNYISTTHENHTSNYRHIVDKILNNNETLKLSIHNHPVDRNVSYMDYQTKQRLEKLFKTNIDCFIYYPLDGYLYKYFGLPKQPEKITWDLLLKIK